MNKIAIAIHGGASKDSDFIRQNLARYEAGLKEAALAGYEVLKSGGSAIDAVTSAVMVLENNEIFNAGKGAALTNEGKVELDASIMNGADLKAGAIAMATQIKNPIRLARAVMEKTNHVLLAADGALKFAKQMELPLEDETYFITPHQQKELLEEQDSSIEDLLRKPTKGTVGAVALDADGNIASATSTGGTAGSLPGRVGDSCIIGGGCYANNNTCAISATGDGEFIITGVVAHSISMLVELKHISLQEACDEVINKRNSNSGADMGVVSVDAQGHIGIAFNCERMHRAWVDAEGNVGVKIYK
jgi:beta-aspartyl-peptidase (threonine type)